MGNNQPMAAKPAQGQISRRVDEGGNTLSRTSSAQETIAKMTGTGRVWGGLPVGVGA